MAVIWINSSQDATIRKLDEEPSISTRKLISTLPGTRSDIPVTHPAMIYTLLNIQSVQGDSKHRSTPLCVIQGKYQKAN